MSANEHPRIEIAVPELCAVLLAMATALPAIASPASLPLDLVVRESEVIAAGAIAGPADEFGLAPFHVTRLLKRPTPTAPTALAVRAPRGLAIGQDVLLFLVADPLTEALGGLTPLDPDVGVVQLDGRAGLPADILAAVDLELDPPADPAKRVAAYLRLLGSGDLTTTHAAARIAQEPAWHELVPPAARATVLDLLEGNRLGGNATSALVDLAAALWCRDTPAALVELVATGAPEAVVERVASALSLNPDPRVGGLLRDALHRAPDGAAPGLLRLVGAARSTELLDEVHARLSSSSPHLRHAAIAACGEMGHPSSLPLLEVLARSGGPDSRDAALAAVDRIRAPR